MTLTCAVYLLTSFTERHSSYRREKEIPIRISPLLLRLDQENPEKFGTVYNTPQISKPEIVYRHVRGRSPTCEPDSSRQPNCSRQYGSTRHSSPSPYQRSANGSGSNEHRPFRRVSDERDDHPDRDGRHDFGGKVRYVKGLQRS